MEGDCVRIEREHATGSKPIKNNEFPLGLSAVVSHEDVVFGSQNTQTPGPEEEDEIEDGEMASGSKTRGDNVEPANQSSSNSTLGGIVQGLLACLRPVWTIIGKASQKEDKLDSWTIPFEEIRELQWLGSGAQGAVFLGVFGNEQVAVKKVRHQKDTDIRHLRHLNHQNIIRFR